MDSNSSTFPSSSSTCHWKVFLSFRGKDTRLNFIGFLYQALDREGIQTFMDDHELQGGADISSELLKAITESKISIVVFSENYASSSWCLNELVKILECRRTMGQLVLPVFYKVDPSHVRHQIGSFGKAFANLVQCFVDKMDKVDKWRAALTEAANLSGYHDLQNDAHGNEAQLIQKIVKTVQQVVDPRDLNVPEHLVGIDSRVKDIISLLETGSNDVRFIGIYGMGGIGKTTIAKVVFNKLLPNFEGSCFLENVRENSRQPNGILRLQEQLISEILKIKKFEVSCVGRGINLMKEKLCDKRVLVVLDDLDSLSQLQSLAEQENWFGSGSRIILTTRDERILEEGQVDFRYKVEELDHLKSLELFYFHAFKKTFPCKDFMDLSNDIVSYTRGLPLALVVLGSFLFRRKKVEWKSALEKLRKIPHNQINEKLRISYDALDDDKVKDIFLDIACFFIGMDKDDAINILDACGFYPDIGISILRERCLLTIDEENQLGMHDLIRDMGREIIREESTKEPGKRSRLWFQEDAYDVLRKDKGTEAIEGISLVLPISKQLHLGTRIFGKMSRLRLLQISNVHLSGSFENLLEELRWLHWHYCPFDCLPINFRSETLVSLDMQYSEVTQLWQGSAPLPNLKILNLSHSELLTSMPDLTEVTRLERLLLKGCKSLIEVHPSMGQLVQLVDLTLEKCYKLKQLPSELGNMKCLEMLDASETAIKHLPDSIGRLSRLLELNLKFCRNLINLPSSICNLSSLETLNLHFCENLERLPDRLGDMKCLEELDVCMTAIGQLPNSIGLLNKLTSLNAKHCAIGFLPTSISGLSSLEQLYLSNNNFHSLPSSLCQLFNLKQISLQYCRNLESLTELPCSLQVLDARDCTSMVKITNLSNLKHLKTLYLTNCSRLGEIQGLECLFNLKEISFSNCRSLESLPELPPNLQVLDAYNCTLLEEIANMSNLKRLKNLDLENCCRLAEIQCLEEVFNLKSLQLTNCRSLRILPKLPSNLQCLYAKDCTSLENIVDLSNLQHLIELNLENCNRLTKIQGMEDLESIWTLNLVGCSNLDFTFVDGLLMKYCERHIPLDMHLPMCQAFTSTKPGSSFSFDLPVFAPGDFLGLALSVVYANPGEGYGIQAIFNNITDGTSECFYGNFVASKLHAWVRYIPKPALVSMRSGDHVEVSFGRGEVGYVMVERCGVDLFFVD